MDVRYYDSLVGQRALWNSVLFQVVQRYGVTAELRFVSEDRDSFSVFFRLYGEATETLLNELRQLNQLLPSDYYWQEDNYNRFDAIQKARIARVVRRIEYVDLPSVSPIAIRGAVRDVYGQGLPPSSSANQVSGEGSTTGERGLIDSIARSIKDSGYPIRWLPPINATLNDLHFRKYCLPLPGAVDDLVMRQRTLYEAIQYAGPAVVSLCVHPIEEKQLAIARVMALNWKRFLDPFAQDIASAGFSDFKTLRESYDRYSLPSQYLFNATIRVAAASDDRSVALANIVASSLGGTKAFRVFPSTKDSDIGLLVSREVDVPSEAWPPVRRAAATTAVERELSALGIDLPQDDLQVDFLMMMPHVYTVAESEQIVRLPVAGDEGLPGIESRLQPPFTVPSLRFLPVVDNAGVAAQAPDGRIRIGMVRRSSTVERRGQDDFSLRYGGMRWHSISREDLTKHALIVGSTGSGKTMSTLFLAREIDRLGVPLMVVEPVKTEYYDRLKGKVNHLYRVNLEGGSNGGAGKEFLAFDPLRVQAHITVARHASYLKSCFEAAFPLDPVMALLLENGLLEYYLAAPEAGGCGLRKFSRGGSHCCRIADGRVYPSFDTFKDYFLEKFLPREFSGSDGGAAAQHSKDVQGLFRRRFNNLGGGLIGECFKKADRLTRQDAKGGYDYFGRYLACNTIVELDAVPDADQKALLMAFVLTYVYERRQAEDRVAREAGKTLPGTLRHMMIVEEAHRVLSAGSARGGRGGEMAGQDSKAKAVSLFVDMLAEIRAFGQGIAIVEQIPTKIVPEAVKNTNLKIMLRMTSKDDRDYLGEAMNFSEAQKRFVTNLKVEKGHEIGFVVFDEGVDQPLLLNLPLPAASQDGWLYDEFFEKDEVANE